jgi:hypothetical protein
VEGRREEEGHREGLQRGDDERILREEPAAGERMEGEEEKRKRRTVR